MKHEIKALTGLAEWLLVNYFECNERIFRFYYFEKI